MYGIFLFHYHCLLVCYSLLIGNAIGEKEKCSGASSVISLMVVSISAFVAFPQTSLS